MFVHINLLNIILSKNDRASSANKRYLSIILNE